MRARLDTLSHAPTVALAVLAAGLIRLARWVDEAHEWESGDDD